MRWKVFFTLILLVALAAAGGVGYTKYHQISQAKEAVKRFEMAVNQINLGQHQTGQTTLEGLLAEFPEVQDKDTVLATLAKSYEATGDTAKARQTWQKLIDQFPGSSHVARALCFVAERNYEDGKIDEAVKYWDLIQKNFADSDSVDDAAFGRIRMIGDKEGLKAARQALLTFLDTYPESDRLGEAETLLGKVNMEILYSPTLGQGDQIYKIQRGDTLDTIGKRFGVSPDLLARINHIAPERIRSLTVGKRLKIPSVNFSIVVDKTENTLLLKENGKFFKRYPCRTGKDDWRTPTGSFRIQRKTKNPTWNDPVSGKTIPPNDPRNELGTRWLAFEGSLGIHGTIRPESIGGYASNGCVGLLMDDVEELYDLVPLGTEVKITGKMKTRG